MRLNLLFDLDGTLTNNQEGIVRCIRFSLAKLGIQNDDSDNLDWCIGPPLQKSFEKLLGIDQKHLVPNALDLYRQRYLEIGMFENNLYEGIVDCLSELGQTANLYVATSKPTVYSKLILKHFSLNDHFREVYGSELDGKNTDKGELIDFILNREKLLPETELISAGAKDVLKSPSELLKYFMKYSLPTKKEFL